MPKDVKHDGDMFDRLIHLPGLRILEPFYKEHKEVLLYLLFGGLSFFLNIFLFIGIDRAFGINELINNIICWIVSVLFQYFTNRTWVFDGYTNGTIDLIKQIASFFGGRIFTLIVEEIIIAIFIMWLGLNSAAVKLGAQVVVIVLNYIISKLVVFKKR